MQPKTMGALFFFTFSRNDDIRPGHGNFFRQDSMENWEEAVWPFAQGEVDNFCKCLSKLLNEEDESEVEATLTRVSSAVEELAGAYIDSAFGNDSDAESQLRSSEILGKWMQNIPRNLVSSDPSLAPILLIPVRLLLESKFANSPGKMRQFYEDTEITTIWPRMDPRIWPLVSKAYGLQYEISDAIQGEIEAAHHDSGDSAESSTPIRSRLNEHLRSLKPSSTCRVQDSVSEFTRIFRSGLEDAFDLVDLELFIEVFPNELYLRNSDVRYKPSFARKLALTAVKQWVHGHQMYKKHKDTTSRSSFPSKDDVIRACIHGHLNITDADGDRDCQYFYSYLRKQWLHKLLRSGYYHIYELFDHVSNDLTLVNQIICFLEDENDLDTAACLLTLSEELRCDRRRKCMLDDTSLQLMMSVMQTGRHDHWTQSFGPVMEEAFILPFGITGEFEETEPIDPETHEAIIIDRLSRLEPVSDFLFNSGEISAVSIDVFFKVFCASKLERPLPSVVTIATASKVFIIMVKRMALNGERTNFFFQQLFENRSILKIFNGTRSSDKTFVLWTLVTEDPFRPSLDIPCTLSPLLDLCDVYPRLPFGELVKSLLGGLILCDFEETSDWSRADHGLLRASQLHFLASRAWLSLQIFHTITPEDSEKVLPCISSLDFSELFGSRFFREWTDGSLDQLTAWLLDNPPRLAEARDLVVSSQDDLRQELHIALFQSDEDNMKIDDMQFNAQDDSELAFLESLRL
jgi:hypothetical protein